MNHQKIEIPWRLIRAKLRQIWLWSKERKEAIQRAKGKCECCHEVLEKKNVHHIKGIYNLEKDVRRYVTDLFCRPEALLVLCKRCHKEIHKKEREKK